MQVDVKNDPLLKEVERLSNWYTLLPACSFAGIFFLWILSGPSNGQSLFGFFILFAAINFIGTLIITSSIQDLLCPRCGNKAFKKSQRIAIEKMRCQWCDYPYKNEFENVADVIGDQWKQPIAQSVQEESDPVIGDQWRLPPK